ncbi:MAG: flagellar biosynthetic protein FliR, partial [Candidatus Gastranaerophilales bacterium]|nr:flagellar biosynthetic protein FliR [Candidatus Gastranaerophilales bacterium]
FRIAFSVVIPIYGILLICDVSLGFIAKMMPQMNIFMVALPVKIYLGLFLMVFFISSTAIYMTNLIRNMLNQATGIFI